MMSVFVQRSCRSSGSGPARVPVCDVKTPRREWLDVAFSPQRGLVDVRQSCHFVYRSVSPRCEQAGLRRATSGFFDQVMTSRLVSV